MSINLNQISSSQFAETQASNINANFTTLKNAVENIPGGGGGGDSGETVYPDNDMPKVGTFWVNNQNPSVAYQTKYKVLAIGNSFTQYPNYPFGAIAEMLGVSKSYNFQTYGNTGAPLASVAKSIRYNSGGAVGAHLHFGDGDNGTGAGYHSLLEVEWDIIVFQQASDYAADYSSYTPFLGGIANAARSLCANPTAKIGFQMIWDKKHGKSTTERAEILENARRARTELGIDLIVPTGTAFENAWANSPSKISLDASGHPNNAFAQYLGAATWYQCLFSEYTGIDIDDVTPSAEISWTGQSSTTLTISVADAVLAAKCAKAACNDMWNVTTNIS